MNIMQRAARTANVLTQDEGYFIVATLSDGTKLRGSHYVPDENGFMDMDVYREGDGDSVRVIVRVDSIIAVEIEP